MGRDDAFGLRADVDQDAVAVGTHDHPFDNVAPPQLGMPKGFVP